MKMTIFWDVVPCSLLEVYRRFRGACCLHHQGVEQAASEEFLARQTTRRNISEDSRLQHIFYFQGNYNRPKLVIIIIAPQNIYLLRETTETLRRMAFL
jgi:hypothetical protein